MKKMTKVESDNDASVADSNDKGVDTKVAKYQQAPLPEDLHQGPGTLGYNEIKAALERNYLLEPGTWVPDRIREASYELRLSRDYAVLELRDQSKDMVEHRWSGTKTNSDEAILVLEPYTTVKLYTIEKLTLPPNVTGRVTPVGALYALGVLPEVTYVDPGFGIKSLWITVCNYSSRIVKLRIGEPIARLEFTKLLTAQDPWSQNKYNKPDTIWPIRQTPPTDDILKAGGLDKLIKWLRTDAKIDPPHFQHVFITHELHSIKVHLDDKLRKHIVYSRCWNYIVAALAAFAIWLNLRRSLGDSWKDPFFDWLIGIFLWVATLISLWLRNDFRSVFSEAIVQWFSSSKKTNN